MLCNVQRSLMVVWFGHCTCRLVHRAILISTPHENYSQMFYGRLASRGYIVYITMVHNKECHSFCAWLWVSCVVPKAVMFAFCKAENALNMIKSAQLTHTKRRTGCITVLGHSYYAMLRLMYGLFQHSKFSKTKNDPSILLRISHGIHTLCNSHIMQRYV